MSGAAPCSASSGAAPRGGIAKFLHGHAEGISAENADIEETLQFFTQFIYAFVTVHVFCLLAEPVDLDMKIEGEYLGFQTFKSYEKPD